jgi:hypothetical protein
VRSGPTPSALASGLAELALRSRRWRRSARVPDALRAREAELLSSRAEVYYAAGPGLYSR